MRNSHITITSLLVLALIAMAVPTTASAQDDAGMLGIDAGLGIATAYVWRGGNIFQEENQMDQNAFLAPAISWSSPFGLTLGYWGAFQIVGDNASDNVDAGVGAEQDIYLGYDLGVGDLLSVSFLLTYYVYPFADEDVTGVSMPGFIEPAVGVTYSVCMELGLMLYYFMATDEALDGANHIYINPTAAKSFDLAGRSLDAGFSLGYKVWEDSDMDQNIIDIVLSLGSTFEVAMLAVTPSINFAWTDLNGVEFGDEIVIWFMLDITTSL